MQKWGINYWDTYAPVVNWISFRTLLSVTKIYKLRLLSIDFVLAFPQADLYFNVYMKLPIGIDAHNVGKIKYFLYPNKSIYGLKHASAKWFETFKAGLNSRYFEQWHVDPCVF